MSTNSAAAPLLCVGVNRGQWNVEKRKRQKGRRLKATLCIKDDAWDVCMTIFWRPEFLPILHCPFLPSTPNCLLLALTPKTIETAASTLVESFSISKELLASPICPLDSSRLQALCPFLRYLHLLTHSKPGKSKANTPLVSCKAGMLKNTD